MSGVSNYQLGFPISADPIPVARSEQRSWSLVSVFGACQSSLFPRGIRFLPNTQANVFLARTDKPLEGL